MSNYETHERVAKGWQRFFCLHPALMGGAFMLLMLFAFSGSAATHYVNLSNQNPASPFLDWLTAATNIQDAIDVADAGDLVIVAAGTYSSGGRLAPDSALSNRVVLSKAITVRSVSGPGATFIVGNPVVGQAAVRCAYLTNEAVLSGFTLKSGATRENGPEIDTYGGGAWCGSMEAILTNCVLSKNLAAISGGGVVGGTLDNCVLRSNRSGFLDGGGAYRSTLRFCTLADNVSSRYGGGASDCVLTACTISSNSTPDTPSGQGGGVASCVLSNCILSGNFAGKGGGAAWSTLHACSLERNTASWGGGAYVSALYNCLVKGNTAYSRETSPWTSSLGGGTAWGIANNCTIVFNTVRQPLQSTDYEGGGTYLTALTNSIIVLNSGSSSSNWAIGSFIALANCCTIPAAGTGTLTNNPRFLNESSGNFRLQANSPCINAGRNLGVSGSTDSDGNPRITGGTVDIGAYELQSPTSQISYAWLQQYGITIDGSADLADFDGDTQCTLQEWIAGTDPTNSASVFKCLRLTQDTPGLALEWQSVPGKVYFIDRATNLAFSSSMCLASNILGEVGITRYIDTNAPGSGPLFYRVGLQQ